MQELTESRTIDLRLNGTIQYRRSGQKVRCVIQYITTDFRDAIVITPDPHICAGEDVILSMTPPFRRSTIRCMGRIMGSSESDGLFEHSRGYLARISINHMSYADRRQLELVLSQKPVTLTTDVKTGIESFKDSLTKLEDTFREQTQRTRGILKPDGYNILVVDDEVPHLNALERTLRSGYNVFSATNGEEALSIMETNDISFIIADQRMPGMSGVEFLAKTMEKYPNVIRMILTAYTDEQLLLDAINKVHVHKYMNKPWKPEEMRTTVEETIQAYEMARAQILEEDAEADTTDADEDESDNTP